MPNLSASCTGPADAEEAGVRALKLLVRVRARRRTFCRQGRTSWCRRRRCRDPEKEKLQLVQHLSCPWLVSMALLSPTAALAMIHEMHLLV
jgi:hypothetical protein